MQTHLGNRLERFPDSGYYSCIGTKQSDLVLIQEGVLSNAYIYLLPAIPSLYCLGYNYLAVSSDLGVLMACSMVLGRPPIVPGRKNPDIGRPDCERGLMPWLNP